MARACHETHRQDQALRILNEVLHADFRCVEARLLAASAHETKGTLAEAADHLALLLAVEPDHLEANRRLAGILGRLGDTRGFVRCLRKIAAITNFEDLDAMSMLGIGLSEDGQHREAIEILQRVAGACPGVSSAQADLGMALLNAGRFDLAAAAMTRALSLDPGSAQAYCGLGLCYRHVGRWEEAAQAFMSTEQLAPDLAIGPYNLALVLEALGDASGARQALFRAAALNPDDEEIERALERLLHPFGVGFDDGQPRAVTGVGPGPSFDASIRGDLTSFPLLDVLEFLRIQRKTGALAVTSRRGIGGVHMVRGQVTSASAPGVKRIGEALVEAGLVSTARLDAVLAKQRRDELAMATPIPTPTPTRGSAGSAAPSEPSGSPESLGSALLREQLVAREQLTSLLSHQIQRALLEMLNWKEGAFSFHPGADQELPPISFDVQELVLDVVRISDERKHAQERPGH
jgi:Flp pilus assembly protein TadD